MMYRLGLVLLFCIVPAALAVPSVVIAPAAVTARGITPGGSVVLFGVGVEPRGYHVRFVRYARVLVDEDRDGVVQWTLAVPTRSIWTVADLTAGTTTIGAPAGYDFDRITLGPDVLRRDNVGQVKKLALRAQAVEVLLVRPSVGAWVATLDEGARNDDDGQADGLLLLNPERLTPLASTPAPDHLRNHDWIVAVDLDQMAVLALEVGP